MHKVLASCVLWSASACASANVKPADEAMVGGCSYLEDVTGFSMLPGPRYVERCKASALRRAEKLGATHVVWTSLNNGAAGRAYRCS